MELYVGMDVSLKETSICVVDGSGEIVSEGTVISEPSAIAEFIKAKAGNAKRIGLETGPTTTWLWHELRALGLPVICIDARHAKAALSLQIDKSDRNDAFGVAWIMQCGWYEEVQVKSVSCHEIRAVLNARAQSVKVERDLENQIRGLARRTSVSSSAKRAALSCAAGPQRLPPPAMRDSLEPSSIPRCWGRTTLPRHLENGHEREQPGPEPVIQQRR